MLKFNLEKSLKFFFNFTILGKLDTQAAVGMKGKMHYTRRQTCLPEHLRVLPPRNTRAYFTELCPIIQIYTESLPPVTESSVDSTELALSL